MPSSHFTAVRRAASALALIAAIHAVPAAAQNPAPAAAPAAPMACDSACHARMMMGQGGSPMGGGMMCPMMGGMQGMGGMQHMGGMQGMGGMQHMGPMEGPPDSTAVRGMADRHAMMTRAYYDALVRRGFSAEQALRIVAAQGMPGPGR